MPILIQINKHINVFERHDIFNSGSPLADWPLEWLWSPLLLLPDVPGGGIRNLAAVLQGGSPRQVGDHTSVCIVSGNN